jgi:diguanylate cyclase (GGDEF)-like protein
MRVLLVEDDAITVKLLTRSLADQHYVVDVATDGQAGWEMAQSYTYNLILLDVGLPKLDGITLCKRLRSQGNQTPVLLLTAQDASTSKVLGLDAGADDYVAKPFDLQELLARIRALLRRGVAVLPPRLEWRNLQLDPNTCEVFCNDQLLHLTPKEYSLLDLFLRNRQRIFSCSALLDHLWSFEEPRTEETVRSHVKGLRQKLKAAGIADDPIETVYGIGYRLKPAEQEGRKKKGEKTQGKKGEKLNGKRELGSTQACETPTSQQQPLTTVKSQQPNSELAAQITAEATKVWQAARDSFSQQVAVIDQATTLLLQDHLSQEQRQEAGREAHRLAGSLGIFGSERGSQLAQAIESLLGADLLQPEQQRQLSQLVAQLHQTVQALDHMNVPEFLLDEEAPPDPGSILIVHPDQQQAELLATEATRWGLRSRLAANPDSARKQIDQHPPDAVILALDGEALPQNKTASLPEALALLAELNQQQPAVPVIVLTSGENVLERVKILNLGGRHLLQQSAAPPQVLEAVTQVLQQSSLTTARVLAVDDDRQVLLTLRALLEPWGMQVFTLDNPLQFLEMLAGARPKLLILDVEMPHVNGIELCQVVRNDPHWSGLPILVLTAHTNAETMQRVFAAGADDYIRKPIAGPELVTRILNRLERSHLLQTLAETDTLTGVANRHKSSRTLTRSLEDCDRQQQPFCFAMLDLDQLQLINHQYSYAAGDQVLFRLGKLLCQMFHSGDVVGRWGGATFVIGMAATTSEDGVKRLSNLLQNLNQIEFTAPDGALFRVTASAGMVESSQGGADLQTLCSLAEALLHQAQVSGGDRILW